MLSYIIKKLLYGLLVLLGVVILVFFLFQGFGDPARLVVGQTGDSATMQNIRKELYLDQPKWKQFTLYLNDVSPLSIHTKEDIEAKKIAGNFCWWQYESRAKSTLPPALLPKQKRRITGIARCFAGHCTACFFSHADSNCTWNIARRISRSETKYLVGHFRHFCECFGNFCTFFFYGHRNSLCFWLCL